MQVLFLAVITPSEMQPLSFGYAFPYQSRNRVFSSKPLNRTGYVHIAFSVGSREQVDQLTSRLRAEGYEVVGGPRTTGDGYYESCIVGIEGNQIEITV